MSQSSLISDQMAIGVVVIVVCLQSVSGLRPEARPYVPLTYRNPTLPEDAVDSTRPESESSMVGNQIRGWSFPYVLPGTVSAVPFVAQSDAWPSVRQRLMRWTPAWPDTDDESVDSNDPSTTDVIGSGGHQLDLAEFPFGADDDNLHLSLNDELPLDPDSNSDDYQRTWAAYAVLYNSDQDDIDSEYEQATGWYGGVVTSRSHSATVINFNQAFDDALLGLASDDGGSEFDNDGDDVHVGSDGDSDCDEKVTFGHGFDLDGYLDRKIRDNDDHDGVRQRPPLKPQSQRIPWGRDTTSLEEITPPLIGR